VAGREARFGGAGGGPRAGSALPRFYDRFSLYFCMRDVEAGEGGERQGYRFMPIAAWRVRLEPYPFVERPARFSLLRRVVPRDRAADLLAVEPERVEITVE